MENNIHESIPNPEESEPLFEASSGIALNEAAKELVKKAVIEALNLAQERLGGIVAGQHGDCIVEIRGVGGSYANGKARFGINSKKTSYSDLRHMEGMKSHTPEGDLVQATNYRYPSDIDLSLVFKREDGSQRTVGDEVVLSKQIHQVLEGIYNETGIFISPHDSDPMQVKSVSEVINELEGISA